MPRKHVDNEIFKFREAKQQPYETIDQLATGLKKLTTTCKYQQGSTVSHNSALFIKTFMTLCSA